MFGEFKVGLCFGILKNQIDQAKMVAVGIQQAKNLQDLEDKRKKFVNENIIEAEIVDDKKKC